MYIPKNIYDSSCNYQSNKFHASVMENALFDLTKDYTYIVDDSDNYVYVNDNCDYKEDDSITF